jgi:ubiquinone/menaquinone biosynthesis C-methylase UbiE
MTPVTSHVPPLPPSVEEFESREEVLWNRDYFDGFVLPKLALRPGQRVLDVGCGQGGLILEIARRSREVECVGADLDDAALERARRRAAEDGLGNVTFRTSDAMALAEFADASFDVVCCQTLLTNVPRADDAIRQMARVTKRGGIFLAAEHWDPGVRALENNVTAPHRGEAWHADFFRLFRLRELGRLKRRHGSDQDGIRVPFLARDAGLSVFDVRLNDKVHFALDLQNPAEADYLRFFRHYLENRFRGRAAGPRAPDVHVIEAGGTVEEAIRYANTYPNSAPEAEALFAELEAGRYRAVFAKFMFLTFARKP